MDKQKYRKGSATVAAVGIILLVAAATAAGYLFHRYRNIDRQVAAMPSAPINEVASRPNPAPVVASTEIAPTPQPGVVVLPAKNQNAVPEATVAPQKDDPAVLDGSRIAWSAPQEISDLKILDPEAWFTKYYQVGKISGGKYDNGKIILARAEYQGPLTSPGLYRFAESNNKFFLLKKYSDELYDGDGLDRSKFSIDANYTMPSLEFPKTISGPQVRQVLTLRTGINEFFDPGKLKKVFTEAKIGDVYTTAGYPQSPADVFERQGFYAKAPDGTVVVYALDPDFLAESNVPQITWNDGAQNKTDYAMIDSNGCGSRDYASVISLDNVNIARDLQAIGKNSKGDPIYELKDQNHQLLKDFYDKGYGVNNDDGQKVSYADFLAAHPLFFWVDPFGRLIKFQSKQFQPAAECGKPVIYLYPEKSEQVSVKIEPKGGLTYSDPAYNNGWLVSADPSGNLTEIFSGKTYPYLFWEGKGGIYESPKKGFVVQKGNIRDFLIEKLVKLGLNKKETADFLGFWEPRMQGSPYYFVSFLGNREMDQIAPLTITPKPDTVIRVLMDFAPLEKPIAVPGYDIQTPARNGFTAVEWGGVLK